jgi:hypothetical protein
MMTSLDPKTPGFECQCPKLSMQAVARLPAAKLVTTIAGMPPFYSRQSRIAFAAGCLDHANIEVSLRSSSAV